MLAMFDMQAWDSVVWLRVLVDSALKGMVILSIAGLVSVLLRRGSAALRHAVWSLAAGAMVLTPLLSAAMPQLQVPILPAWDKPASQDSPSTLAEAPVAAHQALSDPGPRRSIHDAAQGNGVSAMTPELPAPAGAQGPWPVPAAAPIAAPPAPQQVPWPAWVLLAWLAGAAAMIVPMLVGTVGIYVCCKRARRLTQGPLLERMEVLRRQLGVRRTVRLLQSLRSDIPFTWGFWRPAILLPAEAQDWTDDRLRIVLLHELAHVKRGDCLTQTLLAVVWALYWFNPLVYLAARRLRIERERACDDLVLSAGLKASDYASHLLDIVRSLRSMRCPALAAVAMARKSQFEGRVLAILDPRRSRRRLGRWGLLVATLLVVSAAISLSIVQAVTPKENLEDNSSTAVRLVAVRPDMGDDLFTPEGKALEGRADLSKLTMAISDQPHWEAGQMPRDFIFELPQTKEPLELIEPVRVSEATKEQWIALSQMRQFTTSTGAVLGVVPVTLDRQVSGLIGKRPLTKVDLTVRYFRGAHGAAHAVFKGPFAIGQTKGDDGQKGYKLEIRQRDNPAPGDARVDFRVSADKGLFIGAPLVAYDRAGNAHLAHQGGSSLDGKTGKGNLEYRFTGISLQDIKAIAFNEQHKFKTFRNVVVRYEGRPQTDHAESIDRIAARLSLPVADAQKLCERGFTTPQPAIACIDLLRGRQMFLAIQAIRYGNIAIKPADLSREDLERVHKSAARWVACPDPEITLYGVQLGMWGGWPGFVEPALRLVRSNERVRSDAASSLSGHASLLTPEEVDQVKRILLAKDDPMVHEPLMRCLWMFQNRPAQGKALWELAESDKPWLWWRALQSARYSKDSPNPNDLPERLKVKLVALGFTDGLTDAATLQPKARALLRKSLTPQYVEMSLSDFSETLKTATKQLDRPAATKALVELLRRLVDEWSESQVDWHSSNKWWAVDRSVRYLNLWHGLNIGKLGTDVTAESRQFGTDWRAIATEAVRWYDHQTTQPATTAPATNPSEEVWQKEMKKKLAMSIPKFYMDAVELEKVLQFMRGISGLNIVTDPDCAGSKAKRVTIVLDNLPLKNALLLSVHTVGLKYRLQDNVVYVYEHAKPFAHTLSPLTKDSAPWQRERYRRLELPIKKVGFENIELRAILQFLRDASGQNLFAEKSVDEAAKLTFAANGLTLHQVLNLISQLQRLDYRIESNRIVLFAAAEPHKSRGSRKLPATQATQPHGTQPVLALGRTFDLDAFDELDVKDQANVILAGLQARERQLRNFSYKLHRDTYNISRKDGSRKDFPSVTLEMRVKGKVIWMRTQEPVHPTGKELVYITRWDGGVGRALAFEPGGNPLGLIKATEPTLIPYTNYNEILGLRMYKDEELTLAQWLKWSIRTRQKIDVSTQTKDGRQQIVCQVTAGTETITLMFDPGRGLMPTYIQTLNGRASSWSMHEAVVRAAKEVDGLWVPTETRREQGISWGDNTTVFEDNVIEVTVGKLQDKDVALGFPPGTEVLDRIKKEAYRVLPGGRREMLPLYDSDTGKVLNPSATTKPDQQPTTGPGLQRPRVATQPAIVTGIDRDALLKELGIVPQQQGVVGLFWVDEFGWSVFNKDRGQAGISGLRVAVCASRQAAGALYQYHQARRAVGPPMPPPFKVGEDCFIYPSDATFIRDNVVINVAWMKGVDEKTLLRIDELLKSASPIVARGQFADAPELKGLPSKVILAAGQTKDVPVGWSGMGAKQPLLYVSSPGGSDNRVVDGTVKLKMSPEAQQDRYPVTVCAVGEGLVFAKATMDVTCLGVQTRPAGTGPASQVADEQEPYRQLYARYKDTILKAVQAGDANQVAKLTTKFNESSSAKLLYVRVQKLKPGTPGQWEMLFERSFSARKLSLPKVDYKFLKQPYVSVEDGFVLVLPAQLGGGKYEDDVYITMALEPAQPAAGPVASEDEDLLAFAKKNRAPGVWEPDEKEYGNSDLKWTVMAMKEFPQPWSLRKVLAWYRQAKDTKTRVSLLKVMAASRHPKAAVELGQALTDGDVSVRYCARQSILHYFFDHIVYGGVYGADQDAAAADWWKKNKARLIAATQPATTPAEVEALIEKLEKEEAGYARTHRSLHNYGQVGEALVRIGPPAVPGLIKLLSDDSQEVRETASSVLGGIGPAAVPALVEQLASRDKRCRLAAAWALRDMGPAGKDAVKPLIQPLADQDAEVRAASAWALERIGPAAKDALPALIKATAYDDVPTRGWAAAAIGEIGLATPKAVAALSKVLAAKNGWSGDAAADALGKLGPGAEAAVPELISAIGSFPQTDVDAYALQSNAVQALGKIGPAAANSVPALIKLLGWNVADLRHDAVVSLGLIGPKAKSALPALVKLAQGNDQADQQAAIDSIGQIGPDEGAIRMLIAAFKRQHDVVGRVYSVADKPGSAVVAIAHAGPAAVPALIEALHSDGATRSNAALALARIGPPAKDALPDLMKAGNETPVAEALCKLGRPDLGVPMLLATLQAQREHDDFACYDALRALGRVGPANDKVIPALVDNLGVVSNHVIRGAAEALGDIGPAAKAALPHLHRMLEDPAWQSDNHLLGAFRQAIQQIEQKPTTQPAADTNPAPRPAKSASSGPASRPSAPAETLPRAMAAMLSEKIAIANDVVTLGDEPVLNARELTQLQVHRAAVEQRLLKELTAGRVGAGVLLGELKCRRALPMLRQRLLKERGFYGWERTYDSPEAFLNDDQFPSQMAYIRAIEAISGSPVAQVLKLTDSERQALETEALKTKVPVGGEEQCDNKAWAAKWLLMKLTPATGPEDPLRELVRQAIEKKPEQATIRGGQRSTGLDFRRILASSGQDKDLADFPTQRGRQKEAIDALAKSGKCWALAALLDHQDVDVKIAAARALDRIRQPQTVAALLAAAKANNYAVKGSESATLHYMYRSLLKAAIANITGLQVTPKGLTREIHRQPGNPISPTTKTVLSDSAPEQFPEEVDFAQVEGWLNRKYLPRPAASAPAGALWIGMTPWQETVTSLKELKALALAKNLTQDAAKHGEWEIRTGDNAKRVARFACNWPIDPRQVLADGHGITGGTERSGAFEIGADQLQRIGPVQDGEYLLAWYVGNERRSNVMPFKIKKDYTLGKEPLLQLVEIGPAPGQDVPLLALRSYRHAPGDLAPLDSQVAFAVLNINGVDHSLSQATWTGPDGPLRVGEHYTRILDLGRYDRPKDAPVDWIKKTVVFARILDRRSPAITLVRDTGPGGRWDKASGRLAPLAGPRLALSGKVIAPDGKPAKGYELNLNDETGKTRFRRTTDDAGQYEFFNVPPGTYRLGCSPPQKGQPALAIKSVVIPVVGKVRRDLSFEPKYVIAGSITFADGKLAPETTVDLTCEDPKTGAEFQDTTQTDASGSYRLGSPLGAVTYLGVHGRRAGEPMPKLKPGQNRQDYILQPDKGKFRAVPRPEPDAAGAEAPAGKR